MPGARVVLDTNVVLSALVFSRESPARIREAWRAGHFVALVSKPTVEELVRTLRYPKFHLSDDEQVELLGDYLPYCTTVRMPRRPPKIPPCRDPNDRPFLALAAFARANCLVTGDRDLLDIAAHARHAIVTPEQFVSALAGS